MKKISLLIIAITVAVSCDDRLDDLNTPKKNATVATAPALFASGTREMFDMMTNTNVNENVFRLYAQYWAQTTYPDESRYVQAAREIPDNIWQNAYRDVLKDLQEAKDILNAIDDPTADFAVIDNQKAIININMAYTYSVLAELFGDVPFTQALDIDNLTPAYDDAMTVYTALLDTLDAAVASMDPTAAGFPASQDPVYEGDVALWQKFANSLKLRMGIMLADAEPALAQTVITEALTDGVIESNAENTTITYYPTSPNTNPLWEDLVQSGRRDFVIANTVTDILNSLSDPRLPIYATGPSRTFAFPVNANNTRQDSTLAENYTLVYEAEDGSDSLVYATAGYTVSAADSSKNIRYYRGGTYGTANSFGASTKIGTMFFQPDLPASILTYSEVLFLLAEAKERNITLPGAYAAPTAEDYYNDAIEANFLYWGLSAADATAYLAQPSVAYTTAAGDWQQKIGIQSWLALYNRGYEGWTTWRRLDFDGLNAPEDMEIADIPTRFIYPIREGTLNGASVQAAISNLSGGDERTTKLFWDMN